MDPSAAPWRALEPAQDVPVTQPDPGSRLTSWFPIAMFAGAAVLAVAAFLVAASGGGTTEVSGAVTLVGDVPSASTRPAPTSGQATIVVEVAGAVARPGVYTLPAGARVGDAIAAAGGFHARVDAERADRELNLAAPVVDGAEIRVPGRGDPPTSAGAPTSGAGSGGTGGGSGGTSNGLVDLNRATSAELDELPGVGPATIDKILAAREEAPFTSIDELRTRGIVGEKTLEKLRPLVTVGP